ncbi:DgyrCDS7454 [Dimorphilus gyrociliatus]|uniref:DgyrCDS7454 n=1 Tax=Dimorphilus gyrociliatus TaxID=2664684 RepID=A0A7I8VST4_9ANNE|nr:DgyrCDS7454 [Dimorphilus gyrociliatus]
MGNFYSNQNSKTLQISAKNEPNVNNNNEQAVLIPVDCSEQAEAAFKWYYHHVHKPENIVRVLHCVDLNQSIIGHSKISVKDQMEKHGKEGKRALEKYQNIMRDNNIKGSVHFEMGHPGETVVKAAMRHNVSHIVMGTRGFGLIRRTILGSVSEYVIHHSQVPVTVVPKETTSWFF